jgi:hypothetical protein
MSLILFARDRTWWDGRAVDICFGFVNTAACQAAQLLRGAAIEYPRSRFGTMDPSPNSAMFRYISRIRHGPIPSANADANQAA